MIGYVVLAAGITSLALASFIFGGAWCAARGRDGSGSSPVETPRRFIIGDEPAVYMNDGEADYRTQDAEDVNGRVSHGCP